MLALDCHAHVAPHISETELESLASCVVAVTRSLQEYAGVAQRRDRATTWGVGVHPSVPGAHTEFDADRFRSLLARAAVVGEIGLDGRSRIQMEVQEVTFAAILECLTEVPRIASVHSVAATARVLEAIGGRSLPGVVLHWWRGSEAETRQALELGCYFSLNAGEAASPKVIHLLPRDRVLTETDHPFGDRKQRPPRRPGRVSGIEIALAEQWATDVTNVRRQVWQNFRRLATETRTIDLLPPAFQRTMLGV